MRPAPPPEFHLHRFGLWRGGIALLCMLAGAAVTAGWWPQRDDPLVGAMAAVAAGIVGWAAWSARRPVSVRLRWDSQDWFVGLDGEREPAGPCRLDVAIDLGIWMLLRTMATDGAGRRVWIPAQRAGHEGQWHALRRAVYFPRPTVGAPPGAEPHLPE